MEEEKKEVAKPECEHQYQTDRYTLTDTHFFGLNKTEKALVLVFCKKCGSLRAASQMGDIFPN